jgi:hypothetical protein
LNTIQKTPEDNALLILNYLIDRDFIKKA